MFIVFEGLDRAGKSTQVELLTKYIRSCGITVKNYRFPDPDCESGKKLKRIISKKLKITDYETINKLFIQNRLEKVEQMRDDLNNGITLIVDRYAHSNAYALSTGMSLQECLFLNQGLLIPDYVFFLDISPEVASKRSNYGDDIYDNIEFQTQVRQNYKLLEKYFVNQFTKYVTINSELEPIDIHDIIIKHCICDGPTKKTY